MWMCEVCANALDVGGCSWKSSDVFGWLPRAGFEVRRKFLSAHTVYPVGRAEYPQRYPKHGEPVVLRFSRLVSGIG